MMRSRLFRNGAMLAVVVWLSGPAQVWAQVRDWNDTPLHSPISTRDGLSYHQDIYALPFTTSTLYNGSESEFQYQVSMKVRVLNTPFYAGYTQTSFWQAYDSRDSRPFRETNYNPEFFYRVMPGDGLSRLLFGWVGLDLGIRHDSNGQSGDASRSWNRVYAGAFYPTENSLTQLRAFWRVPEDDSVDENPTIDEYYGHLQLDYSYGLAVGDDQHRIHLMARGNLEHRRGAVQLDYAIPTGSDDVYWFVYLFSGYTESLADFDRSNNRIGLGVMFKR